MYLATLFDEAVLIRLFSDFFDEIGLKEPQKIPVTASYPVVAKQGINEQGHAILYLLNYSHDFQHVYNSAHDATELLSGSSWIHGVSQSLNMKPLCIPCTDITSTVCKRARCHAHDNGLFYFILRL